MPKEIIVDTNVIAAANCLTDHLSDKDTLSCQKFLADLFQDNIYTIIAIDTSFKVLGEYFKYSNPSGQPGIGDKFAKWIYNNQFNQDKCKRLEIHKNGEDGDYIEFPDTPSLNNFDLNDRKYVAICVAANKVPHIVNGTDSDWYNFAEAFLEEGISIENICCDELEKWSH